MEGTVTISLKDLDALRAKASDVNNKVINALKDFDKKAYRRAEERAMARTSEGYDIVGVIIYEYLMEVGAITNRKNEG